MLVIDQEKENEESRGTEGARRATGVAREWAEAKGPMGPDPEVTDKAKRRRFSAEYKLRVLREADQCRKPGELGALLRREGIYSSSLSTWRRQREVGELVGLRPEKRGRKARPKDSRDKRIAELEHETRLASLFPVWKRNSRKDHPRAVFAGNMHCQWFGSGN